MSRGCANGTCDHRRVKIDDQLPLAGLRLRFAVKLPGASAIEHDHMVKPLISRMGKPRLRIQPGQRRTFRIAR